MADKHRSRTAWPGPLSIAGVGEGHTHDLPKALRSRYRLLMVAVIALLLAVGTLTFFVYQQQQYIEGRGEYRDREAARMEEAWRERLRIAQCDLLDTFPEGVPALERARAKYDCGPGLPLSMLTPEETARLEQRRDVAPPAERTDPAAAADRQRERPPFSDGADPVRPPPQDTPAPPRPTVPPALDDTVTTVCNATGVCIN